MSDQINEDKRVLKLPPLENNNNTQSPSSHLPQEPQTQQQAGAQIPQPQPQPQLQLQPEQQQQQQSIPPKKPTSHNLGNNQKLKSLTNMIQSSTRKSLCHGRFSGQFGQTPSGPYIYVPCKWGRNLDAEDYIDQIFESLGISDPPLVFLTLACPEILPQLGLRRKDVIKSEDDMFDIVYDNPTISEKTLFTNVMLSRMTSVVSSIAEASATCNSIFLCCENVKGNPFDEMILKSLPESGIAISLTSLDFYSPEMMRDIDNSSSIVDAAKTITWTLENHDDQKSLSNGFSNFLIFQTVEDKNYFLSSVQQYLSVGLFCVGGTESLLNASIKCIKTNTPLFVFKYTLCAGHSVSSLIEYYSDIQRKKYESKSIEERLIPNEENNYFKIDQNCLDAVQSIAYNWPNNSNLKNIIIINPLKQLLSNRLLEIIDVMSTKTSNSEYGGYMSDLMIKKHAVDMIEQISLLEKKFAVQVYIFTYIIITLSLLITLVAILQSDYVLYSRTYLEKYNIGDLYYYFTLIAPIILGILITISTTFNLENTWTLLTLARHKIIYTLYRYRCNTTEATLSSGRNKLSLRAQFAEDLQEVWQSVSHLEISSDVLSSVNNYNKNKNNQLINEFDNPNNQNGSKGDGIDKDSHNNKNNKYNKLKNAKVVPKNSHLHSLPDHKLLNGHVDLFRNDDDETNEDENGGGSVGNSQSVKHFLEVNRKKLNVLLLSDESIRNLTCEEYISERVIPEIKKLESLTPKLLFIYRLLTIGVIVVSSVGTILTSQNVQVFIPVLFAFAHCFHQIISFHQLPLKIKRSNMTYTILKKTLLWWSSLSLLEQMIISNKNHLVETVEDVLLADIETITHARSKENQSSKKVGPTNKSDGKKRKKGKNKKNGEDNGNNGNEGGGNGDDGGGNDDGDDNGDE